MKLRERGLWLMYLIFVFAQWVISSLLQQRERAAYLHYLLSDTLSIR
jgi:hypothetical protein